MKKLGTKDVFNLSRCKYHEHKVFCRRPAGAPNPRCNPSRKIYRSILELELQGVAPPPLNPCLTRPGDLLNTFNGEH